METLLLIDARPHTVDTVKRIRNSGIRVVFVQKPSRYLSPAQGDGADCVILTDYESDDFFELAHKLNEHWNFTAVLALAEMSVGVAARLNEAWGISSTPFSVTKILKNKFAMREHLNKLDFSYVPSKICHSSRDLEDFLQNERLPVIIKPIDGDGSRSICKLTSTNQIHSVLNNFKKLGLKPIVERWIDGKEYSVECFSASGKHQTIGVTEKHVNSDFVETGHIVPANIEDTDLQKIGKFVTQFLTNIGITDGPSHTEIKITTDGIKVIESHNRIGGGNIELLVNHVYKIDMSVIAAKWACKIEKPSFEKLTPNGCAVAQFFIFPPGPIKSIRGTERLRQEAGSRLIALKYIYHPGDIIPAESSGFARMGYFVISGNKQDETWVISQRLAQYISVEYDS